MKFKEPKEVASLTIITDRCTGCGSCIEKCKRNVFEMDREAGVARVVNLTDCVGCGKCVEKMCNFEAISLALA